MSILGDSLVSFELKQMTPIIHFQGSETGAGIRASELKPKLDKFLQNYFWEKKKDDEKKHLMGCLIKKEVGGALSFDYKVRIKNDQEKDIPFYKIKDKKKDTKKFYGAFYGELGSNKSSFFGKITITFITKHECLKKAIETYFPILMSVTSFGRRQNKGYGYFKVINRDTISDILEYGKLRNQCKEAKKGSRPSLGIYQIGCVQKGNEKNNKKSNAAINKEEVKECLNNIDKFHKILKSGYGRGSSRLPSVMLEILDQSNNPIHEKKALKEFRKFNDSKKSEVMKYYVRGLLGLAYEYDSKEGTFGVEVVSDERSKVERFASPIHYLPVEYNRIILLVDYNKIEKFREDKKAVFELKGKEGEGQESEEQKKQCSPSEKITMTVPSERDYSIYNIFEKEGILEEKARKNSRGYFCYKAEVKSKKGGDKNES